LNIIIIALQFRSHICRLFRSVADSDVVSIEISYIMLSQSNSQILISGFNIFRERKCCIKPLSVYCERNTKARGKQKKKKIKGKLKWEPR